MVSVSDDRPLRSSSFVQVVSMAYKKTTMPVEPVVLPPMTEEIAEQEIIQH